MVAEIPTWLRAFLEGSYFSPCKDHVSTKNERNHFCVDCCEGPLCHTGLQAHTDHTTLQVRRASHMDAVRINDIHKLLDTASIQPYTINGAKIVFLLSRPQSKATKGCIRCCEICGRSISDPVRFCSISCKLACVTAGYDETAIVGKSSDDQYASDNVKAREEEEDVHYNRPMKRPRLQLVLDEREGGARPGAVPPSPNSVLSEMGTPTTPGIAYEHRFVSPRSHRKGVPHRSPLS